MERGRNAQGSWKSSVSVTCLPAIYSERRSLPVLRGEPNLRMSWREENWFLW